MASSTFISAVKAVITIGHKTESYMLLSWTVCSSNCKLSRNVSVLHELERILTCYLSFLVDLIYNLGSHVMFEVNDIQLFCS